MAEIDDTTLNRFRELEKLIGDMNADPEARRTMERAIKKVRPNVETEEDIVERNAAPIKAELEAARKEFQDYKVGMEKREAEWREAQDKRSLNEAFADLRKSRGYTDDGIKEIAEYMVKNSVADPYAAAARYDQLHPAPPEMLPSSYEPQHWKLAPEEDVKQLFTDENAWEANAVRTALDDVRRQAMN